MIIFSKGKQKARSFMRPQAMFFHRQKVHYRTTQLHGHALSCVNCCCIPSSLFTNTYIHGITRLNTQLCLCPDRSPPCGQVRCCIATGDAASRHLCSVQSVVLIPTTGAFIPLQFQSQHLTGRKRRHEEALRMGTRVYVRALETLGPGKRKR
jgi:hypothetical protein